MSHTNPKAEAQATLMALKELLAKPQMTTVERLSAMTYVDFALTQVDRLTVARARKGPAQEELPGG